MMTMQCPVCHVDIKANPADWRLPPWCPRCGASVQAAPQNVEFYSPLNQLGAAPALPLANSVSAPPAPPLPTVEPTPPAGLIYFDAFQATIWEKDREHYRFYPTHKELLVIRVRGSGGEPAAGATLHTPPVGGYRWTEMLDAADEAQLRGFAVDAGAGFVIEPAEVEWLRLEPPSGWKRFFALSHEGLLTLSHSERGKLTYALPTFADIRRAISLLPRLFGNALRITVGAI